MSKIKIANKQEKNKTKQNTMIQMRGSLIYCAQLLGSMEVPSNPSFSQAG